MNLYYFIFKRISLFFLLIHVSLFTRLRYGKGRTAAILGGCFALESLVDYALIYWVTSPSAGLLALLAEIVIVQAGALLASEYRDMFTPPPVIRTIPPMSRQPRSGRPRFPRKPASRRTILWPRQNHSSAIGRARKTTPWPTTAR